jgi:leucyl aminopeptidase
MEIKVTIGKLIEASTQVIALGVFEGTERLEGELCDFDQVLGGVISGMLSRGEFKGKPGEMNMIYSLGKLPAEKIVLFGLGKGESFTPSVLRRVIGELVRFLREKKVVNMAVSAAIGALSEDKTAQMIAEGAILGDYAFDKYLTKDQKSGRLENLVITVPEGRSVDMARSGVARGKILAEMTNFARDMVNEPANVMTPAGMAEAADEIAGRYGLDLVVLEEPQLRDLGMGALLGVAQGSNQPPKFIVLSYKGKDEDSVDVALVGKGITFDSGGISLKPADKMDEMKTDMAGGAAAIAAIGAIAELKPKINVTALVPAVENMPSGSSIRPGDILKTMSGKTVEIISTDAEGRLILADGLGYARLVLHAARIIDVATLTGACVVALGKVCTGAFSNDSELVGQVIKAGEEAGEYIWQLPIYDEYKKQNKSNVADIKNTGGRDAGAITAALFLAEFADDTPWVHLDIAGTSTSDGNSGSEAKGATGVPVRTLVNFVLGLV